MNKVIEADLNRLLKHFVDFRPTIEWWENGESELTDGPRAVPDGEELVAYHQLEEVASKIVDQYFKEKIEKPWIPGAHTGENAIGLLAYCFFTEKVVSRQLNGSVVNHHPMNWNESDDLSFDEQTQSVFRLGILTNGFTLVRDIFELIKNDPHPEPPMTDEQCEEAVELYPTLLSWSKVAKSMGRINESKMKSSINRWKRRKGVKTEPAKPGRKKGT